MTDSSQRGAPAAIEILNLRKTYREKEAVSGLTLRVARGEVFGFLGANGAGKSTVVKIMMGLVYPTSGTARIMGQPIGDLGVKARIGFLPEHFRFHDWLRAGEFLEFHGQLYGMPAKRLRQRVTEVLEIVGLASRANDALHTFSKGMLQRVGLGQALLNDPDLVFLDEPTSALDPLGRRDVRDIIGRLKQQGKTVFLNSHLLSEVEMVCDRVAILDHGRVVRQGSLQDLLSTQEVTLEIGNLTPDLRELLATKCRVLEIASPFVNVALDDRDDLPALAELIVNNGGRLYAMTAHRLSLETLFVSVVESRGGE